MVAEPPDLRPAWSSAFAPDAIRELEPVPPLDEISREWAWGGSTGAGVKVAVIDSGIDAEHPAVGGRIGGYVAEAHEDSYGHGTACAGIIRSLAPTANSTA